MSLDVTLLDSKQCKEDRVFCDVILFSNHILQWEQILSSHYASQGYVSERKSLAQTSHRLQWRSVDTPVMSITVWPKSSNLMLQPGKQHEKRIL